MKKLTISQVGIIVGTSLILMTWLKIDKLASYWEQQYGDSQFLTCVAQTDSGKLGSTIGQMTVAEALDKGLIKLNQPINNLANNVFYKEEIEQRELLEQQKRRQQAVAEAKALDQQLANQKPKKLTTIQLVHDTKALFIGDSLMQGIAPWVMRKLQNDHQIDSIDLSKHSTGLTSTKFYNWPEVLENTLIENPDVKALFVFLGGNDGQSIIDPETERHVRFGTERWDEVYSGRIQLVLDTAQKHGVQVMWIAPPIMKDKKLNEQVGHISEVLQSYLADEATLVIDSKEILQSDTANDEYSDSISVDEKLVKVRTADGVHFTPRGQKIIANDVMAKIVVEGQEMLATTQPY